MLPGKHHCRWTVEENEKIKGLTSNRENARVCCSFIFIVSIIPSVTQDNKCVVLAFFGCVFTQTSTHCLMEQMTAVRGSSANRPGPAHSVCRYMISVHKNGWRLPSVLSHCFPQQTALPLPGKQQIPPPKQWSFCKAVLRSAPSVCSYDARAQNCLKILNMLSLKWQFEWAGICILHVLF